MKGSVEVAGGGGVEDVEGAASVEAHRRTPYVVLEHLVKRNERTRISVYVLSRKTRELNAPGDDGGSGEDTESSRATTLRTNTSY